MRSDAIAVVVSGFPRRSETFALNELLALHRAGMLAALFATKPGEGDAPHPACEPLLDMVEVLPPGSVAQQAAVVASRVEHIGVSGIHGYFAHTPAEVAKLAAERVGIPYGFSVHARDARKIDQAKLVERARSAACVVACNPDVAADLLRAGAPTRLIPHGVDLERFQACPPRGNRVLRLLAVGRLVEKKGFAYLLQALVLLDEVVCLDIVGEGPELAGLRQLIDDFYLNERVTLRGSMTHDQLPAAYAAADVVVVPSVVDRSGDRDGLPNVVLEAMASARPVVASDIAAIASAVRHCETGLLVSPGEPHALAKAIRALAASPHLRESFGCAGRRRAEAEFELQRCTRRFVQELRSAYA